MSPAQGRCPVADLPGRLQPPGPSAPPHQKEARHRRACGEQGVSPVATPRWRRGPLVHRGALSPRSQDTGCLARDRGTQRDIHSPSAVPMFHSAAAYSIKWLFMDNAESQKNARSARSKWTLLFTKALQSWKKPKQTAS